MYFFVHHVIETIIHQPMAIYTALFFKLRRNDAQAEMSATGGCTGMASMQGRFVLQLTFERCKSFVQLCLDAIHTCAHCGSFMYLERKRLCATMKATISPMPPNNLKLTQVAVEKL